MSDHQFTLEGLYKILSDIGSPPDGRALNYKTYATKHGFDMDRDEGVWPPLEVLIEEEYLSAGLAWDMGRDELYVENKGKELLHYLSNDYARELVATRLDWAEFPANRLNSLLTVFREQWVRLHNRTFLGLMNLRRKNPGLCFWLRVSRKANKLDDGYWFQGNDTYAFAGLYRTSAGQNRTRSIGLVFWPDHKELAVSFEVVFGHEESPNHAALYKDIIDLLIPETGFAKEGAIDNNNRFRIVIAYENAFEAVEKFLKKYKDRLDSLVRKHQLEKIFIERDFFEYKLENTLAYWTKFYAGTSSRQDITVPLGGGDVSDESDDGSAETEELTKEYDPAESGSVQNRITHMAAPTLLGKSGEPLLGVEKVAQAFTDVLIRSTQPEDSKGSEEDHFFGIFGQWGRGKTYFWELIKSRIEKYKDYQGQYQPVEFHAWKYQETPAVWAYLYEKIASFYYHRPSERKRSRLVGIFINKLRSIRLNYYRDFERMVFSVAGFLGIFISLLYTLVDWPFYYTYASDLLMMGIVPGASALSLVNAAYRSYKNPVSKRAETFIKKYGKRHSYKAQMGIQHEIQEELKHLLKAWHIRTRKKFVLFIDDIDRCSYEKILGMVDSIRVMLNDAEIRKHIIVLAAIDERILTRAIQMKYKSFIEDEQQLNQMAIEYFDKLFIAGIRLNVLSTKQKQAILLGITAGLTAPEISEPTAKETPDTSATTIKPELGQALSNEQVALSNTLQNSESIPEMRKTDLGRELRKEAEIRSYPGPATEQKAKVDKTVPVQVYQLSKTEQTLLAEQVTHLKNGTPRSIRNFTIKYRMARSLLTLSVEHVPELKDLWEREFNLRQVLVRHITASMNQTSLPPDEINDDMRVYIRQAVEMVTFTYRAKDTPRI